MGSERHPGICRRGNDFVRTEGDVCKGCHLSKSSSYVSCSTSEQILKAGLSSVQPCLCKHDLLSQRHLELQKFCLFSISSPGYTAVFSTWMLLLDFSLFFCFENVAMTLRGMSWVLLICTRGCFHGSEEVLYVASLMIVHFICGFSLVNIIFLKFIACLFFPVFLKRSCYQL